MPSPRLCKLESLILDPEIYPRHNLSWLTALQYVDAMKAGSVFPPIIVGRLGKERYVIDGWHRLRALKILGEESVQAITRSFSSKGEMFLEAVKLNTTHGRRLSVHDTVRIIDKLTGMNFTVEKIKKIMKLPVDRVEKFKARTIRGPNGRPIYLKGVVHKTIQERETSYEEILSLDQSHFSVGSTQSLMIQLIELLQKKIVPGDDKTKGLAAELLVALKEWLK